MEKSVTADRSAEVAKADVPAASHGLSMLFAPGMRPSLDMFEALFASDVAGRPAAQVLRRSDDDGGGLELLAGGLTFEVSGLGAVSPLVAATPDYRHGFDADRPIPRDLEAITLMPGEHIRAGAALLPVVKTMTSLIANLSLSLSPAAVCWHPARCWIEAGHFSRMTLNWVAGGEFPVPGLVSLSDGPGGAIRSDGLAHFIGQEIHLEPRANESAAETGKLAARLVNFLVDHGPVAAPLCIALPGETLQAEPSKFAGQVWIWREG